MLIQSCAPLQMGWDDGVALFDWCEPNYVGALKDFKVAETWNTITALPYVFIGLVTVFSNWSSAVRPQHLP